MKPTYEHVYNGGMEIDAGWDAVLAATTGISSTQAHRGTYSWSLAGNAFQGLKSTNFATITGTVYYFSCWIYNDDGTTLTCYVRRGSGAGEVYSNSETVTLKEWTQVTATFTETAGGSGAFVGFALGGSHTVYIDDVSLTSQVIQSPDPFYKKTRNKEKFLIKPDKYA